MTSNLRMILTVAFLFVACLATSVANASAFTITVRITDHTAVESQIGACAGGYHVTGMVDGRPRSYGFHNGVATIPVRSERHTFPHLELACGGVDRGMPTTGVDVAMH